jgi:ApbE superfamily uncharacterized protein (UPF0280 family)
MLNRAFRVLRSPAAAMTFEMAGAYSDALATAIANAGESISHGARSPVCFLLPRLHLC